MEEHLINLKMAAKELTKNSKKCEQTENEERLKVKRAIAKNNLEAARIFAENAIRQKNQSLNYLKMSSQVDAVYHRVQAAVNSKQMTQHMEGVVKAMSAATQTMDLQTVTQLMEKFETLSENLDVQGSTLDDFTGRSIATQIPQNEVDKLLHQVAEENGLEANLQMPAVATEEPEVASTTTESGDKGLEKRLAELRHP